MTALAPYGRAAAQLKDLAPCERLAVEGFRRWCGSGSPDQWPTGGLGAGAGSALCALCRFCTAGATRRIQTGPDGCPGLVADETDLAALIATAVAGDRDGAMAVALNLVRADHATTLVAMAAQAGLALRRALLQQTAPPRH